MFWNAIAKREVMEEIAVIAGLIIIQFVYAGNAVLMSYLLSLGINPFSFIVFSTFATFLVLSPIAFLFERKQWPKKLSFRLLIQLVLIAFSGVTLFQYLILAGLKLTSPVIATAMPNLAPGFIFAIACAFGLEKVKASCLYSKVKILGTLLCVAGAVTMSIFQSTTATSATEAHLTSPGSPPLTAAYDTQKIAGCMYLMGAVFVLSSNVVLQAHTLGDFPAPISLCAVTSLIGVIITAVIQLAKDGKFEIGQPSLSVKDLICFSLLAGSVGGTCVSFNGWAMKRRGPVLVSMFSPISTVVSVIFSVITLGYSISLGSLGGMFVMFAGLYFVLWAKGKEGYAAAAAAAAPAPAAAEEGQESEYDIEKPLLS
ncbi:hypothetical protein Nepgr_011376 [Nepenthes gracilis]|uniref:WAT1-related protein n=1 Tax=Nepenthes gracilis TaxID=150966 RepID=A0AAD3SF21_NEPGR|nr:hypothetical protein Nepgr_011376 [Nepenthes gracilis]